MYQNNRVAAIIPAKDEAQSIKSVIDGLLTLKDTKGVRIIDDIVVCDNGSIDKTAEISQAAGARVVNQSQPGYGIACLTALAETKNADILLFIDGDNAFRAHQALPLIDSIAKGKDLAIGSRKQGSAERHALTIPQQFGNWLASRLIHIIWGEAVTDLGPFRAASQESLQRMSMEDETYGWTIEMQIKAIQLGMTIEEHPVDTYRRLGRSKISGTIKGTIGAGIGILSMIALLRWRQFRQPVTHVNYPA
ncbi:MAG: glycosyl hydrolase [marine bacterium B5-7]|nr:MAG: glycosyl hydrolase [marine bacterium B5-7]